MRLLDKRTVNAEVATQKKQAIDEGLRLARKVDALRDSVQVEQGNLEDFRKNSIALVQAEIDEKLREKTNLESQLARLRWERQEFNKPVNVSWVTLGRQKEAIETIKDTLYAKRGELDHGISLNIQRERENEEERRRLSAERLEIEQTLARTQTTEKEAKDLLIVAQEESNRILSDAKEREKIVKQREIAVEDKEVYLTKVEKMQQDKEKEQADKDREINDRYQTLLRTEANLP